MFDLPEDLEDGKRWLPFDVYQEIMSNKFNHKAAFGNSFKGCTTYFVDRSIKSAFRTSSNVNPINFFGNGVSRRVHSSYDFGAVSRVFYSYTAAALNRIQVGMFERGATRSSRGYSRGTGVFIPRVTNVINEYTPLHRRDYFAVSPASLSVMEKRWKQMQEKKESYPVSTEICLPEEWTY